MSNGRGHVPLPFALPEFVFAQQSIAEVDPLLSVFIRWDYSVFEVPYTGNPAVRFFSVNEPVEFR